MSFTCNQHGWSHLLEACPYCFQYSMSGDATDTSKITFTKEQVIDLAIETWKAREVCWNMEREQLRSKLSAAEKDRDQLRETLAATEGSREHWRKLEMEASYKLAVAVEALKWYANPNHWEWTTHESTRDGCGCTDLRIYKYPIQAPVQCGGKHASEALKAIGGE